MKYDFYSQVIFLSILVIISIFSLIPGFGSYFILSMVGILPLGIWQLISASIQTARWKNDPSKMKHLKKYWWFATSCLVLLFGSFAVKPYFSSHAVLPFIEISIAGSVVVALYYLFIYKKFIITNDKQEDSSTGSIVEPIAV